MKLKTPGKIAIFLVVLGIIFGGYRFMSARGMVPDIIPGAKTKGSEVPIVRDIKDRATAAIPANVGDIRMPGDSAVSGDKGQVRFLCWAWNSQMGMMFANGGPKTTEGSLMQKNGVNLQLTRQDDASKMQEALLAFATELSQGNANPTKGAHFVAIMGDGSAAFLAGLNKQLEKLGPDYRAKVIGSCGYSYGEDKLMGPQSWKDNPQQAKGGVISGYLRDGDWNIAQKWMADNGIKNNPDEKTWDPDAVNWVAANDYIDACEKYVADYTEERPVVRNGKKTGEKKTIHIHGVVTWTPGDVIVAEKKGGLVSIVSTKEYSGQMPNVIIGIDRWMRNNSDKVEGMLHAIADGGAAVRTSTQALNKAGEISQQVYNEDGADAAYWVKYYNGTKQRDKQGIEVDLGGSYCNTIADEMLLFGLYEGTANIFAATYTVFGDVVKTQYPDLVPSYPPVDQILDTQYVKAVANSMGIKTSGTKVADVGGPVAPGKQTSGGNSGKQISNRAWSINFKSGSAEFTPTTMSTLEQLRKELLVASGARVEIHGHTDNVGNPNANMSLSESRAFAVKKWLQGKNPANFPDSRVKVFAHGQTNPVVPNSSDQNRARNRRVEIRLVAN
jgi:OOP family OmpA-OmpF porin